MSDPSPDRDTLLATWYDATPRRLGEHLRLTGTPSWLDSPAVASRLALGVGGNAGRPRPDTWVAAGPCLGDCAAGLTLEALAVVYGLFATARAAGLRPLLHIGTAELEMTDPQLASTWRSVAEEVRAVAEHCARLLGVTEYLVCETGEHSGHPAVRQAVEDSRGVVADARLNGVYDLFGTPRPPSRRHIEAARSCLAFHAPDVLAQVLGAPVGGLVVLTDVQQAALMGLVADFDAARSGGGPLAPGEIGPAAPGPGELAAGQGGRLTWLVQCPFPAVDGSARMFRAAPDQKLHVRADPAVLEYDLARMPDAVFRVWAAFWSAVDPAFHAEDPAGLADVLRQLTPAGARNPLGAVAC
ncbi:hypothetical protein ACFVVX_34180 [Kitasatospora sp. NPDC058170]|uniref:hypothetical protein n=1 Tax=Kitasatospora sp. NPDC058170 TaxID=3346364 RepID=UPI0036DC2500